MPIFIRSRRLLAEVERLESDIATAARSDKAALKTQLAAPKARFELARKSLIDAIKARQKQLTKAVKELGKLQDERDAREQEVKLAAEREINHLREAAADLQRICASEDEARRYFAVVERAEIVENEFNLNLPRYVDTFETDKVLPLEQALKELKQAGNAAAMVQSKLSDLLNLIGLETGE